jgi:hypothetical protein
LLTISLITCRGGGGHQSSGNIDKISVTIGSSGGTIEETNSSSTLVGFKMDIPPGALVASTNITIEASKDNIPLPSVLNSYGEAISLSPEGLTFNDFVTITIPYETEDVPVIVSYNESTRSYEVLPIVGIENQNKKVTVQTNHFSIIGKVGGWIQENLLTNFNINEDAFSINNNSGDLYGTPGEQGGACWGFASYSKWYFENRKEADGINLWGRYGDYEKWVVSDAMDIQMILFNKIIQVIKFEQNFFIYPLRHLVVMGELNTALFITGKPQVLGLGTGIFFNDPHAVLVYAITTNQNGYVYHIYDNVDNTQEHQINFDTTTGKFENYRGYTEFIYLGAQTFINNDAMQQIYDKYKNVINLVWEEYFESYSAGSFPSAWTPDGNATSSSTNYVDNTVFYEGTKSLRLFGTIGGCWAALVYRPLNVSYPYEIEVAVRNGDESLSGCHPDRAYIGIRQGTSWYNPGRCLISFKGDGTINGGGGVFLGSYKTLTWYTVRIRYQRPFPSEVKLSYWINGTYKGSEVLSAISDEDQLTNIDLTVQEATAWFDVVKVFY